MKTKAILATLLVAAAASADARFAWPYPSESELTTTSLSGSEPDGLKASPTMGKMPQVAERSSRCRAQESRKRFHVL
jgi:hypothetical protein